MKKIAPAVISGVLLSTLTLYAANSVLQTKLEAMAAQHHGKLALYATNLRTGETVAIDADIPVATASVIKLAILVEAMEQVETGKHKLSDKITLQ